MLTVEERESVEEIARIVASLASSLGYLQVALQDLALGRDLNPGRLRLVTPTGESDA